MIGHFIYVGTQTHTHQHHADFGTHRSRTRDASRATERAILVCVNLSSYICICHVLCISDNLYARMGNSACAQMTSEKRDIELHIHP